MLKAAETANLTVVCESVQSGVIFCAFLKTGMAITRGAAAFAKWRRRGVRARPLAIVSRAAAMASPV